MTVSRQLLGPPRGMRDFYPDDLALRRKIFEAWRRAGPAFGFLEYDACVVESLDLLVRKAGEEIVDQIYAFKDKSGRDLALRPEMTPTLARMVSAREGALRFPLKWFCIAQCFRYERMTKGRKREHYQWNLDIVGTASVAAETETIAAAVHAMSELGLHAADYSVRFSSRALLAELLGAAGVQPERHASAFIALDKRGKLPDDQIEAMLIEGGLAREEAKAVFDVLDLESLEDARRLLNGDTAAALDVMKFIEFSKLYGLDEVLEFDIGVVRGLAYYTGIVFEAFDRERRYRALFGGGRYDNLLADIGGSSMPGVGLGFGDVVVADLLESKGEGAAKAQPCTAVAFMREAEHGFAMRVARMLRGQGQRVSVGLEPEKPKRFFARVSKEGMEEAVFIGPDDVQQGTFRIKHLPTRTEKTVILDSLS